MGRENQEFCFDHVKSELCMELSDGTVEEAVVCGSLKLRRAAWAQDTISGSSA